MPGKKFIKVTSLLFAIEAIISLILYPIAGLMFEHATIKTSENAGWLFVVICLLYTLWAVLQLIASIKGIKGCNKKSAAADLKKWGYILIVIALITGIINFAQAYMSGESVVAGVLGILVGLLLPGLYIHGAALNAKA